MLRSVVGLGWASSLAGVVWPLATFSGLRVPRLAI